MKKNLTLIGCTILLLSSCVLTLPMETSSSSDTTSLERRDENEIQKEQSLNAVKVKKQEEAKAKQEEKNAEEQKNEEGKGGGKNQ